MNKCTWEQWEFGYPPATKPVVNYTEKLDVIGIDSEAYDSGEPFLWGFSNGRHCHSRDFFNEIFRREYEGKTFVCYNQKYEEGAILYYLDVSALKKLNKTGRCEHEGYIISVIPRKEIRIRHGHHSRRIYDIAPYYNSSLQRAAELYLGESKHDIETKKFTPEYVVEHYDEIIRYCVQDSRLTKRLADRFIDTLADMNLYPKKLISTGYISAQHFRKIYDSSMRDFYEKYPECCRFAYESYSGGKFEVYKRGFGNFHEYDINSAYPHAIANLYDLRGSICYNSRNYHASADYGFLHCNLDIQSQYNPVVYKTKNINIYPQGHYTAYIGKSTYEYLISRGNSVEILDAWWIETNHQKPYEDEIMRLYQLKNQCKHRDEMKYLLIKILMNSLYGKFLAITPIYREWDDRTHYYLGDLANFIYASVITESTRLQVCRICEDYPDDICAVHTDSIISSRPLPISLTAYIGGWDEKIHGDGVIIGSGVYQIGEKNALRGFHSKINLCELLKSTRGSMVNIEHTLVKSWKLNLFQHTDDTNKFIDDVKILDLNFDKKRVWPHRFSRRKTLQDSDPIILFL